MYRTTRMIRYCYHDDMSLGHFVSITHKAPLHERLQAMSIELSQSFMLNEDATPEQFLRRAIYTAMFYYERECTQPVPHEVIDTMRQHHLPQFLWLKKQCEFIACFNRSLESDAEKGDAAALFDWYVQIAAYWAYYRSEEQIAMLADRMLCSDYAYSPNSAQHVCEQLFESACASAEELVMRVTNEVVQEYRERIVNEMFAQYD